MYCYWCGHELSEGAAFCGECGKRQETDETEEFQLKETLVEEETIDEIKEEENIKDKTAEEKPAIITGGGKSNFAILAVGIAIVVLLGVIATLLFFNIRDKEDTEKVQIEEESLESAAVPEQIPELVPEQPVSREQSEPAQGPVMDEEEPKEQEELEKEDEQNYILPDSGTVPLSREDLEGLNAEQLRIARNEIYARHGRKFQDENLQAYFESQNWYVGIYEPDEFSEEILSEVEKHNRDLVMEYEKEMGWR